MILSTPLAEKVAHITLWIHHTQVKETEAQTLMNCGDIKIRISVVPRPFYSLALCILINNVWYEYRITVHTSLYSGLDLGTEEDG